MRSAQLAGRTRSRRPGVDSRPLVPWRCASGARGATAEGATHLHTAQHTKRLQQHVKRERSGLHSLDLLTWGTRHPDRSCYAEREEPRTISELKDRSQRPRDVLLRLSCARLLCLRGLTPHVLDLLVHHLQDCIDDARPSYDRVCIMEITIGATARSRALPSSISACRFSEAWLMST